MTSDMVPYAEQVKGCENPLKQIKVLLHNYCCGTIDFNYWLKVCKLIPLLHIICSLTDWLKVQEMWFVRLLNYLLVLRWSIDNDLSCVVLITPLITTHISHRHNPCCHQIVVRCLSNSWIYHLHALARTVLNTNSHVFRRYIDSIAFLRHSIQ